VGAVQRGQLDAAFEIFDPEVEVYSSPELANPRTFRGVEDLVRWITTWNEAWESFRLDAVETVPIGEHHAARGCTRTSTRRSRSPGNGKGSRKDDRE
jgi:hypothetical protein